MRRPVSVDRTLKLRFNGGAGFRRGDLEEDRRPSALSNPGSPLLRTLSLFVALFAFWLLLSGHYTVWLIGAGALVAAVVAAGGRRVGYGDREGHPVERIGTGLLYWPWLVVEILKSSLDVTKVILSGRTPEPRFFTVDFGPRTPVGIATYANSITLTPGTITVEVDPVDHRFRVHALTAAGEAGVREGGMDRRVRRFEGGR